MKSAMAPLRKAVKTRWTTTNVFAGTEFEHIAPVIIHTLECGHEATPLIRIGCRLPPPPKRRRCQKCLQLETESKAQ